MEELLDLNNSKFRSFLDTRDHYLSNANEMIKKNELRKASELLWGAITQELKALAFLSNISLGKHKDFIEFINNTSKELEDEELYKLFNYLEDLHVNFYHDIIREEVFPDYYEKTLFFLRKLEDIKSKKIETMKQ